MKFIVFIYLTLFAKKIGKDEYHNSYYLIKNRNGKEKRMVFYKGKVEASKVSPKWESWLRFSTDAPINNSNDSHYIPNRTGTKFAYYYKQDTTTSKCKSFSSWQGGK